jgi:hypothetical protein
VRTSVDVHNYLVEREVPHELFSARGRLPSPERLAAVLDLPSEDVGKVVVFEDPAGGVAVIVPSAAEPDPGRFEGPPVVVGWPGPRMTGRQS